MCYPRLIFILMFILHYLVIAENVESITNHDNAYFSNPTATIFGCLPTHCYISSVVGRLLAPVGAINQSAGGIMPTASGLAFSQRCSFDITFTPCLFLKQIKKYSWAITLPLEFYLFGVAFCCFSILCCFLTCISYFNLLSYENIHSNVTLFSNC